MMILEGITIKNRFFFSIVFLFFGLSFSQESYSKLNSITIPGSEYYTDELGSVYFYVNILGHVKNPGSYPIYEKSDLLSIISQAGGPLEGAKLNKIILYRKNSKKININLESYLDSGEQSNLDFKPNDTIYLEQSLGSYLMTRSSIISWTLSLLNIYLTKTNN